MIEDNDLETVETESDSELDISPDLQEIGEKLLAECPPERQNDQAKWLYEMHGKEVGSALYDIYEHDSAHALEMVNLDISRRFIRRITTNIEIRHYGSVQVSKFVPRFSDNPAVKGSRGFRKVDDAAQKELVWLRTLDGELNKAIGMVERLTALATKFDYSRVSEFTVALNMLASQRTLLQQDLDVLLNPADDDIAA